MMPGVRRLLTIPISHYCEKARWALERAGLDYVEEPHVQGVHVWKARRAGGGTTVPVLIAPDGVFNESEAILRYADERTPESDRLFPADADLRDEVVAVSRDLDEGLGPDGRRWIYAQMLQRKPLVLRYNNQGVPRWEDALMRALYPFVTRFVKRKLGVGATTIEADEPRVWRAFDEIAARLSDGRRYLCGDRFTAADLTFACLAAPAIAPTRYGVRLPQPSELPAPLATSIERFRAHPAGVFALRLYAERAGA